MKHIGINAKVASHVFSLLASVEGTTVCLQISLQSTPPPRETVTWRPSPPPPPGRPSRANPGVCKGGGGWCVHASVSHGKGWGNYKWTSLSLDTKGYLEYHTVSRPRKFILVWPPHMTNKLASACFRIRVHSDLTIFPTWSAWWSCFQLIACCINAWTSSNITSEHVNGPRVG